MKILLYMTIVLTLNSLYLLILLSGNTLYSILGLIILTMLYYRFDEYFEKIISYLKKVKFKK